MLLTHADRVREMYPDRADEILQLAAETIESTRDPRS
jgi:hypothetical protein